MLPLLLKCITIEKRKFHNIGMALADDNNTTNCQTFINVHPWIRLCPVKGSNAKFRLEATYHWVAH